MPNDYLEFQEGDQVIYCSECIDHNENQSLEIGAVYTIEETDEFNRNSCYLLKEANWWVAANCVRSVVELDSAELNHPNRAVILKVRRMIEKRKRDGYAF